MIGNPWDYLIRKFEDTSEKVYKFKFTGKEMHAIYEAVYIEHTDFGEELSLLGEKRCRSILDAMGESNYENDDSSYDMEMTGGEASLLVTAFKDYLQCSCHTTCVFDGCDFAFDEFVVMSLSHCDVDNHIDFVCTHEHCIFSLSCF